MLPRQLQGSGNWRLGFLGTAHQTFSLEPLLCILFFFFFFVFLFFFLFLAAPEAYGSCQARDQTSISLQ